MSVSDYAVLSVSADTVDRVEALTRSLTEHIAASALWSQREPTWSELHPVTHRILDAFDDAEPRTAVTLRSGGTAWLVDVRPRRVELWVTDGGRLLLEEHRGRVGRLYGATCCDRQTRGSYDLERVLAGAVLARRAFPRKPVGIRATQQLLARLERLGARFSRRNRDAGPRREPAMGWLSWAAWSHGISSAAWTTGDRLAAAPASATASP